MTNPPIDGIRIEARGNRVVIEVDQGRWEGDSAQAERLLTQMHYVLARARPGTNIVSMFVNGTLWGGKTIETDPGAALEDAQRMLEQLLAKLPELVEKDQSLDH